MSDSQSSIKSIAIKIEQVDTDKTGLLTKRVGEAIEIQNFF